MKTKLLKNRPHPIAGCSPRATTRVNTNSNITRTEFWILNSASVCASLLPPLPHVQPFLPQPVFVTLHSKGTQTGTINKETTTQTRTRYDQNTNVRHDPRPMNTGL